MAQYYYNKYNTIVGSWNQPPVSSTENETVSHAGFGSFYKSGTWSPISKTWTYSTLWGDNYISAGQVGYQDRGSEFRRYTALESSQSDTKSASCRREIYYSTDATPNYSNGGSLLQSNIVAENGTYPVNGRHTDGNWYIRGAAVNTAPTIPGTFTQPTGTLEIGGSKVVSWVASTDAENNLSKYVLEASLNGGAFAVIAQPASPTYTYIVPTATSVKFRVKAVDAGGLESAYRDSALVTITKPMYYWSKYNITKRIQVDYPGWGNVFMPYNSEMRPAIYVNPTTLAIILTGNSEYVQEGSWLRKDWYVTVSGTIVRLDSAGSTVQAGGYTTSASKPTAREVEERGALNQSNITAVEGTYPTDGKHTDGFWYVRGSRVSQSIAPPAGFTSPAPQTSLPPKQSLTLTFGASTAPSISTYELEHRYNEGAWTPVGTHSNTLTRPFTVTENKGLTKVEFRVRAKNTSNVYSDYVYSESFIIEHNKIPTVTLNTPNNETLYENDTFKIDGSALDTDVGDILNVYYRINGGLSRAIATGISTGVFLPFNEQLTFKGGKLLKGEIEITDALAEGPAHRLEVWSEDNQGGKSPVAERTFYVVPNRAPSLTVDPFTDQSELIKNDTIKLAGSSSDPDGNDVTVKYRVNEEAPVQIHSGAAGPWSFDVSLKSLKHGENNIVVEVTDTHNFKSSKTIKLNKTENLTPLEHSVQRYKIVPPNGSAQGVLLWIQRDADQEVTAEISMTIGTEQEQFVPLPLDSTVPMGEDVEDYFKYRADTPAEHIALKISWTGDKPITFISGALLQ
ncbi:hypothetical protein H7992_07240 [Sporosarcina sp. resist]|uniref:hypothetical protein n=1 Tax=Sporosarcina sp. resist TaxID=2762563 RepID=UPI00164DCD2E|nr:hypothetical protein [Sporosarcina sp. resist]QNK89452.1 hypothetical protein H7992_07240 [Sporosarcina sp. resist]